MSIEKGMWRHSKSVNIYEVLMTAKHSETLEEVVVYQAQYDSEDLGLQPVFVRPLRMWNELVEIDGKKISRFVKI